jgi:hypothetical protein
VKILTILWEYKLNVYSYVVEQLHHRYKQKNDERREMMRVGIATLIFSKFGVTLIWLLSHRNGYKQLRHRLDINRKMMSIVK